MNTTSHPNRDEARASTPLSTQTTSSNAPNTRVDSTPTGLETCTEAPIRRPPIGARPKSQPRTCALRSRKKIVRSSACGWFKKASPFPFPLSVFALQIWDVISAPCQRIPSLGSTGRGPPSYHSTAAHLSVRWRRPWDGRRRGRRGPPACRLLGPRRACARKEARDAPMGSSHNKTEALRCALQTHARHARRACRPEYGGHRDAWGFRARMWRRGRMMTAVVVASGALPFRRCSRRPHTHFTRL